MENVFISDDVKKTSSCNLSTVKVNFFWLVFIFIPVPSSFLSVCDFECKRVVIQKSRDLIFRFYVRYVSKVT